MRQAMLPIFPEPDIELMQSDCLELMQGIPDGSVDMVMADPPCVCSRYSIDITASSCYIKGMENKIIKAYRPYETTLREVARQCKTDHHTVKRVLLKNGIAVVKGKIGSFTQEHKDNISKACKGRKTWSKGKKMTRSCILKNMKAHLKYDVSLEWLNEFDDIEKLKYLNNSISRKRDYEGFTTEIYQQFIEKFYNDKKFNDLFSKWKTTKDKWMKPSLDHIQAKCNGGSLLLDNLQFVSWLENKAKVDIDQKEWDSIKARIYEYF